MMCELRMTATETKSSCMSVNGENVGGYGIACALSVGAAQYQVPGKIKKSTDFRVFVAISQFRIGTQVGGYGNCFWPFSCSAVSLQQDRHHHSLDHLPRSSDRSCTSPDLMARAEDWLLNPS